MIKNAIILLLLMISYSVSSQETTANVGEIKSHTIKSDYLGETSDIQLYLPPSYHESEIRKYPVIYVLDGQEYFFHPITYQRMLRFKDKTPECIVVGINSDRRNRRVLYHKDAAKFVNFLQKELIPLIDKKYRTLKENERIYFGWEMAGGLGLEIFTKHHTMFSAFFIASPTHITEKRILALTERLKTKNETTTYIYTTKAPEETYILKSLNKVDSIFKMYKPTKTTYKIETLQGEDHYTTSLKTINNGLRDYFNDYNTLRYYNLKEYDAFGDLASIKKYYKHRGERYGISPEVHKTTRHFLLLNAMREDNLNRFQTYVNEFKGHFQNVSRELWSIRFGGYFFKHKKYKEALKIYEAGLQKFPESAAIYNAIGTCYKEQGKTKKATHHYKKAVEFAMKNNDEKLEMYKADLEKE